MRAVIQRVLQAQVEIEGCITGQIGAGLLVYASVGDTDSQKDVQYIADKITGLRIFSDDAGKMNLSVKEVKGGVLLISNFTLHSDCRKGRRPGFDAAAEPQAAEQLYDKLIESVAASGIDVQKGVFGAHMHVSSINDWSVTFILESRRT